MTQDRLLLQQSADILLWSIQIFSSRDLIDFGIREYFIIKLGEVEGKAILTVQKLTEKITGLFWR